MTAPEAAQNAETVRVDHLPEVLRLRGLLNDIWGVVNDPYLAYNESVRRIKATLNAQFDGSEANE